MTKKGLAGAIKRSGSKLGRIKPGTGWVGAREKLGGARNQGVIISEKVIREGGISERANLCTCNWGVIKINNTVRNE